jgi:hypothetical protein
LISKKIFSSENTLPNEPKVGNGFRGEESKKSANQKQESPLAAMFVNGSGRNDKSLQRTFHRCFLPSFGSFGKLFQRRKFLKICIEISYCILNTDIYI